MTGELDIYVFEDETPEELKAYLSHLHKDFHLTDLSNLYAYLESEEAYELCQAVKEWENENI